MVDYEGNITNLMLHVLCTIEVMKSYGICHNDLHLKNIIVTKSNLTHVKYCFGVEYLSVAVMGELPVLIDFGLANIQGFKYKPIITGITDGTLGSIINDSKFDQMSFLYWLYHNQVDLGREKPLYKFIKVLSKPILKTISDWIWANSLTKVLWRKINLVIGDRPHMGVFVDYYSSGILLSFPKAELPPKHVIKVRLDSLENWLGMNFNKVTNAAMTVLKAGALHPQFFALTILGQLLRDGVQEFISKFKEGEAYVALKASPLNRNLIDFMAESPFYKHHIFTTKDQLALEKATLSEESSSRPSRFRVTRVIE